MSDIGQFDICLKCEILIIDIWNEYIKKSDGTVILLFYSEFNIRMPIIWKKLRNLMNLVHCQKQLECHQRILNKI